MDEEKYGDIGAGVPYRVTHWDEGRYGKENGVTDPADDLIAVTIAAKKALLCLSSGEIDKTQQRRQLVFSSTGKASHQCPVSLGHPSL